MNPPDPGTLISAESKGAGIKAVAAKMGLLPLKSRSGRMLNAYGFMKNIFEIFEYFKTAVDMVTTSEVAVSVTIDNSKHLDEIVNELKEYGDVEVDKNQTIVCIVGNMIAEERVIRLQGVYCPGQYPDQNDLLRRKPSQYFCADKNTNDKKETLNALSEKLLNL